MAILKVAQMGHPILRKVAKELSPSDIKSVAFQKLIEDMIETMHEYEGIGLAAPQVHQSVQLCLLEIEPENPRYGSKESMPLKVVINPKITPIGKDTEEMWEGCLSVHNMRGLVRRPARVKVQGLDEKAKKFEWELEGLAAVVIQHETDHLFGTLYVDRLVDTKKLAFLPEYEKYWSEEGNRLPD
jgi:peptide deformylase